MGLAWLSRAFSLVSRAAVLVLLLAAAPAAGDPPAPDLADFTSDGCSLFPDGTLKDRAKWCDCCLSHDMEYWAGGTEEERKRSDERLRDCVLARTGDTTLAETMYLGVRAGGHPAFPTWYRWAYGWPYGRGYKPLTNEEQQIVKSRIDDYWKKHPGAYCDEIHPQAEQRPGPERRPATAGTATHPPLWSPP